MLAILAATLDDAAFSDWGWRIPFLLSAVLMIAGYWIRSRVQDAPLLVQTLADADKSEHREAPVKTVLRTHRHEIIQGCSARLSETVVYYMFAGFVLVYAVERLDIDKAVALNAIVVGTFVQIFATPLFGALSDRVGRRPVLIGGAAASAIWIWIFFALLDTREPMMIGIATALLAAYGSSMPFRSLSCL